MDQSGLVNVTTGQAIKIAWDDSMSPAFVVGAGGSAPDLLASVLASGTLRLYGFDGGSTTEQIYFTIQLPHSYKEGSDLYAHVHWMPVNTNAGNVKWQLEYSVISIGATFGAPTTISVTTAAAGIAWRHQISSFPTISGSGLTISNILIGRLFRNPTDGADTYESDAAYLGLDIHFQQDSVGSLNETSKG